MDAATVQLIVGILHSELVKETASSAARFIRDHGKQWGENLKKFMEKGENGKIPDGEKIPEEVQAEIKSSLKEILKEASGPVYMDGVALFCEQALSEDDQKILALLFTSMNDDQDTVPDISEEDEEYMETVNNFLLDQYGGYVNPDENDFVIGDDVIYLNFGFDRPEDYFRVYKPDSIRQFVDALNQLLGDKYITRFTVY